MSAVIVFQHSLSLAPPVHSERLLFVYLLVSSSQLCHCPRSGHLHSMFPPSIVFTRELYPLMWPKYFPLFLTSVIGCLYIPTLSKISAFDCFNNCPHPFFMNYNLLFCISTSLEAQFYFLVIVCSLQHLIMLNIITDKRLHKSTVSQTVWGRRTINCFPQET